jgi:outer membrane protein assembly factor BamB
MKPTFIPLLALCLCLGSCGEKEPVQPSAPNTGAGSRSKPKVNPTKHKRFLWEFETGSYVESSPAIGSDGTVYVGSEDKKLYAINPKSGVKLWEFVTGGAVGSSPAIGPDGTLYIGSGNKLYAIKTDSKGLAKSPWPMRGQNARHTGRVMKK